MPDALHLPDVGLVKKGDVYFMGPNDNQYVLSGEHTVYDPLDSVPTTGVVVVEHVPDGAAAAAVTHLGRGLAMRVYGSLSRFGKDEQRDVIYLNYQGFRFYSLGGHVVGTAIPAGSLGEMTPAVTHR